MRMNLSKYKAFIDEEMLLILGQLDSPSHVFDFLYLGSEWNASNLEELKKNGFVCFVNMARTCASSPSVASTCCFRVGYVLNVTREIDNFFPGSFEYLNIRLYDVDGSDLMKHWDKTYKFIKRAK